ncbi:hypothetical protein ILUMI_10665, partial [Ignelater luminosus]
MVFSYQWLGVKGVKPYDTIFTPTVTSGGLCFTFNMLNYDEIFREPFYRNRFVNHQPKSQWTLEGGFSEDSGLDTFPRRTIKTGTSGGFQLTLYESEEDSTQNCGEFSEGYK